MTPRLPLVYNPRSGFSGLDLDALLARLPADLRERLAPVRMELPFDFGPSIAQARAAGGPLLVWGGDGTLHYAGCALAGLGCPVPLAAIPGGSGNGMARGLRTPLDPAGAVVRLLEGRELAMDLPRLDGEPFLNLCGTGFEAAVAAAFETAKGRGFRTYVSTSMQLWRRHPEVRLDWDAEPAGPAAPAGRMDRLRAAWRGPQADLPQAAWSLCFANLPQYRLRAVDRPPGRPGGRHPGVGAPAPPACVGDGVPGAPAVPGAGPHLPAPGRAHSAGGGAAGQDAVLAPGRRATAGPGPGRTDRGTPGVQDAGDVRVPLAVIFTLPSEVNP